MRRYLRRQGARAHRAFRPGARVPRKEERCSWACRLLLLLSSWRTNTHGAKFPRRHRSRPAPHNLVPPGSRRPGGQRRHRACPTTPRHHGVHGARTTTSFAAGVTRGHMHPEPRQPRHLTTTNHAGRSTPGPAALHACVQTRMTDAPRQWSHQAKRPSEARRWSLRPRVWGPPPPRLCGVCQTWFTFPCE